MIKLRYEIHYLWRGLIRTEQAIGYEDLLCKMEQIENEPEMKHISTTIVTV